MHEVSIPSTYVLVNTPKRLHWLREKLAGARRFSFDIETNVPTGKSDAAKAARAAMSIVDERVVGVSFSWAKGEAAYIPLYTGVGTETHWPIERIWNGIIAFLRDVLTSDTPKIAHNGKFDISRLMRLLDVDVNNFVFDTMLAHTLIDEERAESTHKLKDCSTKYIDPKFDAWDKEKDRALDHYDPSLRRYSTLPLDILYPYGCADADMTLQLADYLADRLAAEGLDEVMDQIMMPLSWVAMMSELHGMPLEAGRLEELDASLRAEMEELLPKMYELVDDKKINFSSTDQLGDLLYKKMGFEERRTEKGEYNVDAEGLKAIKDKHPLIPLLIRFRRAQKVHSTYVVGPLAIRDRFTYRVYHTILVGMTKTGRCACVHGDTLVETHEGPRKISSLTDRAYVLTHERRFRSVIEVFTKGEHPMFDVVISVDGSQRTLRCTSAHRLLFSNASWITVGDLRVGDLVVAHGLGETKVFGACEVVSITPAGTHLVWDLTVSEDHSYVAQGFVNHNSENPNTQNLPRPENGGLEAKSVYAAPPGKKIILADLSQVELVITADLSQEPVWLEAFRNGEDLHSKTAQKIFNLPCTWQEVKKLYEDRRTAAKCFHPDTEVLTRTGWRRIVDLVAGEEVMQAHAKAGQVVELEWVVPTEVFTQYHPDKELIHFYNEGMDIRVTPDHRMLTFSNQGHPRTVFARDFHGRERSWMNAGMLHNDVGLDISDTLLKVLVAVQAAGHITPDGALRFGFKKVRKIERLRALLDHAGIDHTWSLEPTRDITFFYIRKDVATGILGHLDGKSLPWGWLNLNQAQRMVVLDEVAHWDGHKRATWRMTKYSNTDRQSVDVLQAIAAVTGRKTRVRTDVSTSEKHSDLHGLTIRDKAGTRGGNLTRQVLPFTDKVACLTVPSGFVLVRDRGVPLIIHQSVNFGVLYGQTEMGLAELLKITVAEAQKLIEDYFNGLSVLKAWIDSIHQSAIRDGYVTNPFGRRRHLPELKLWEPGQQTKPNMAPGCWAQKNNAPQVKAIFPDIELPRQLPVLQNSQLVQSEVKRKGTPDQQRVCSGCPYISSCVIESYRRMIGTRKRKLLREAGNFMIQSTATADISAKWWFGIALEAQRQGIPISWRYGSKGGCPINLVHDEVMFVVDDEYIPAYLQIIGEVLKWVYPQCSLPLRYDVEVVQAWHHKHIKDEALHFTAESIIHLLEESGKEPYALPLAYADS